MSTPQRGSTRRNQSRFHRVLPLVLLVLLIAPALARDAISGEPALDSRVQMVGQWTQGGLIRGKVPPGTQVQMDGKSLAVAKTGDFIIGFSRDAALTLALSFRFPDGDRWRHFVGLKKRDYDVQKIKGLPSRKVSPNTEDLKRIKADRRAIDQARSGSTDEALFVSGFIWPVKGRISGIYGSQRVLNGKPRRPHLGIDVAAPDGTPIMATADGIVRLARPDTFFSGNLIILDHGLGLSSTYAHMSRLAVAEGQRVQQGQVIGAVGATGRATGPHLHWSLNLNGFAVDPATVLPAMKP